MDYARQLAIDQYSQCFEHGTAAWYEAGRISLVIDMLIHQAPQRVTKQRTNAISATILDVVERKERRRNVGIVQR
jgi:hypothetical protein